MFVEFCEGAWELSQGSRGQASHAHFNKYPVSPVHDKYKTKFDAISPNGREFNSILWYQWQSSESVPSFETINGQEDYMEDVISEYWLAIKQ